MQPVHVVQVVNPYFAQVEKQNGEIDTVSTRHLSPGRQAIQTPSCSPDAPPEALQEQSEEPTGEFPETPVSLRPIRNRKPPERLQIRW